MYLSNAGATIWMSLRVGLPSAAAMTGVVIMTLEVQSERHISRIKPLLPQSPLSNAVSLRCVAVATAC